MFSSIGWRGVLDSSESEEGGRRESLVWLWAMLMGCVGVVGGKGLSVSRIAGCYSNHKDLMLDKGERLWCEKWMCIATPFGH